MYGYVSVWLLGVSAVLIGLSQTTSASPEDEFRSNSSLPIDPQFRLNSDLASDPSDLKSLSELEERIEEQLKKSELVLDKDFISESMGSKQFCELHKEFLKNMCSALGNVKQMSEEWNVTCYGKEQELKDLRKLLVDCAKARVRLQKEVNINQQAIDRAVSKAKKSSSEERNAVPAKDQPVATDKILPKEPTLNSSEFNFKQDTPDRVAPAEQVSKQPVKPKAFQGDLKDHQLEEMDQQPSSNNKEQTSLNYEIPEELDGEIQNKRSPIQYKVMKYKVN